MSQSPGHRDTHSEEPLHGAAPACAIINGDRVLTPEEHARYMAMNRARNRARARASRHVRTQPGPMLRDASAIAGQRAITPARMGMNAFFDFVALALRGVLGNRPITVVDIGCGSGTALEAFVRHGYQGSYLGLDISRHRKWKDGAQQGFERALVLGDIHALDLEEALRGRAIDLLLSSTALEHFEDDRAALARITPHLANGAAQAHYVPGEAALDLYGPHGFRQYSPNCLQERFPGAEVYRFGGVGSNLLHRAIITRETRGLSSWRERFTRGYDVARHIAVTIDRWTGNTPASAYGVLVRPSLCGVVPARVATTDAAAGHVRESTAA